MKGYLIDTCILYKFLTGQLSDELNTFLMYEYEKPIYISIESLHEFVIKKNLNKLGINFSNLDKVLELTKSRFDILPLKEQHLLVLDKLSKPTEVEHNDPFDRIIISQAICEKLSLISTDHKFQYYKDNGFQLIDAN